MYARPLIAAAMLCALLAAPAAGQTPDASFDALYKEASEAYRQGRHGDAAPLFRRLIDRDPEDPALEFYLADALSHIGQHDSARLRLRGFLDRVTRSAVPIGDYQPEIEASVELLGRLRTADATDPEEGDAATVFGGVALGAGVAAAGLLAGYLITDAQADDAEARFAEVRDNPKPPKDLPDGTRDYSQSSTEANQMRRDMDEANGRATAFAVAAGLSAGIAVVSTVVWGFLPGGDARPDVTPVIEAGGTGYGGVMLGGRF